MSQATNQHSNILLAILGFIAVVIIVAAIGFFTLGRDPEVIQGQVEVSEYRVSGKVPGRILEIRVTVHPPVLSASTTILRNFQIINGWL